MRKIKIISELFAFTLAEILIVVGIIGIIAQMTIPQLIADFQVRSTVARLKKVYSSLSNSFNLAVQENGTPDMWGMGEMYDANTHITMANKFIPYLKINENCVGKGIDEIKNKCAQNDICVNPSSFANLIIADGIRVIFRNWYPDCTFTRGVVKDICGSIGIDVNGPSRPNIIGKDLFYFYMTKTKIVPVGIKDDKLSFSEYCNKNTTFGDDYNGFSYGVGCTAWVIYNENMDYLKCDDLSWDGKTKCD